MPRLAVLAMVAMSSAYPAEAAPRKDASTAKLLATTEAAASECFAQAVLANPGAMAKARAGLWYEAAGVIGFICRPEVSAMMAVHDKADGKGAGMRAFRVVFVRNLGRVLATRLGPDVRVAVAHAEPPRDNEDAE